ncbi:NADase-type glycan-binding domain-containing protein [Streptomyces sp. NPDC020801]|uniref:NADase-type glycan-binding domain-containing protein n=1 Tax=Streptomyces sp. NPDC020801 TaxID=3365093 RepID=UPI0037988213
MTGFWDGAADRAGHTGGVGGRELCATCGTPAHSGEMFCVSCGAYLGWDDTGARAVVREAPPAAHPGHAADAGWAAQQPASVPASWQQPPSPVPPSPVPPSESAHPPPSTGPDDPASLVGQPGHVPMAPACDRPHTALQTGPHMPHHEPTHRDGDLADEAVWRTPLRCALPCPECGTDNDEARSYCCSCGAGLRPAPKPPQLTGWQRLRKRWDERPRPWHLDRRWLLLPVAMPFCFAAVLTAASSGGTLRAMIPAVQDRFSSQVLMAPSTVEATSEANGYEASKSVDGVDNRAWAPEQRGEDAVGQSLTARFPRPFRLTGLVIVNGAGKEPKQYLAVGRLTRLSAIAVTADGTSVRKEITLADQPGPQDVGWGVDDVVSIRLRISGVHAGLQPGTPVAVAEVQFFTRQDT